AQPTVGFRAAGQLRCDLFTQCDDLFRRADQTAPDQPYGATPESRWLSDRRPLGNAQWLEPESDHAQALHLPENHRLAAREAPMSVKPPIQVFIVDDSAVVRQVLSELLANSKDIQVIGTAADPLFALQKMQKQWPDVILLDIEMPRMDGITFLRKIMQERPTPVIICSTLTQAGAPICVDALGAGAVELIAKPKVGLKEFLVEERQRLIHVIQSAAQARLSKLKTAPLNLEVAPKVQLDDFPETRATKLELTTERVVAIGASTGGTQALEAVLSALPATAPGITIVQHMPEKFTATFAERLNRVCQIEVREATSGDRIRPGLALIAPGGRHMQVKRSGAQYVVEVRDGPPVNRH